MKRLLITILLLTVLRASANNWTNYPVVSSPASADTFLIGTTTTNQQLSALNLLAWVSSNISASNLVSPVLITGTDTNVIIEAVGGGSITLSNGVTGATLIMPATGAVTASGGFTATNITIQGNLTISNTIYAGAIYIATNSAPAHVAVMGESDFSTNGAVILTSVKNVNTATYAYAVLHVFNTSGGMIPITPPVSWYPTNGTWNVTNGGSTVVSVYVGPGPNGTVETNAISYPQR